MQRKFSKRFIICLIPVLVSALIVGNAFRKYYKGEKGFNLGIDLVGGTILVYELDQATAAAAVKPGEDPAANPLADVDMKELASSLKRRLDPADLRNITIRPVGGGKKRIEIILPTGGGGKGAAGEKKDYSQEEIEEFKQLIKQVGSLEFRIVANNAESDDEKAIAAAQAYLENPANKDALKRAAIDGMPPPAPQSPDGEFISVNEPASYAWAPMDVKMRNELGLNNAREEDADPNSLWRKVADARKQGKAYLVERAEEGKRSSMLIYSRETESRRLSPEDRKREKYDYFVLTRNDPSNSLKIGGPYTLNAKEGQQVSLGSKPNVSFELNAAAGNVFGKMTRKNQPSGQGTMVSRQLGILLDGRLVSAPHLNEPITTQGQITGNFTQKDVQDLVRILKAGALPASLKPLPVSENTIGATLGEDTIRSGTIAVLMAFAAILVFMIVYYRFAGLVASIALLANLLLTVAFMVMLHATFTLPGLAGLVLTLGMAVDANVLIYERVREERDRGNSIATALRNGYDRAFPTIIDTHLSSIFTAIVLYAVGNDQLKGFGVSLTVGLVISLFTSLYMTRLVFDFCLAKGWLKQLRMMRMFSRPNINFMAIRKQMFMLTGFLTVVGLGLFLSRGSKGLNVDFVGGTAYGGQLKEPMSIGALRKLLDDDKQLKLLAVDSVTSIDDGQGKTKNAYRIKYKDGTEQKVMLANEAAGETPELKEKDVAKRAGALPDWSVEQIFLSSSTGTDSRYFTIRTTEMEPELVQVAIDRLFRGEDGKASLMATTEFMYESKDDKYWILKFIDPVTKQPVPTSLSFVKTLLDREFRTTVPETGSAELIDIRGEGDPQDGRFTEMRLDLADNLVAKKLTPKEVEFVLKQGQAAFASRPQPERLETFDSTLAGETKSRAVYAILASWLAILLYLWFRFGNWTFGAAAVVCLIHDICFTLGCIALCYYLHDTMIGKFLGLKDFKIDLPAIAALLTLVGYSVNDTIVVFDRIREVRGKNPKLTEQMINDSVNQTLSRTLLASLTVFLVVVVLYIFGGDGVHLFAFVMIVGVVVGTYSSIYIASPLLLIFGEGTEQETVGQAAARQLAKA